MFRLAAAFGATICLAPACSQVAEAPPQPVRIATGNPRGVYYEIGTALERLYNQHVPGIYATVETTGGSSVNVDALENGTADLGFARAEVVYGAYAEGTPLTPRPHTRLRGIATLYTNVLHVVVPRESRIEKVADLQGTRIGLGVPISETIRPVGYLDLVSSGGDLAAADVEAVTMNFDELNDGMKTHKVHSAFFLAGYPNAPLTELAREMDIRLLEIDPDAAARIRGKFPFYKPAVIPPHTYVGQQETVRTIGVDNLMVCREDVDEDLVYRLTKAFFELLPELAQVVEVANQVNSDLAPATPIPLHRGAARYYRERELVR